jgi:hypothetical protein
MDKDPVKIGVLIAPLAENYDNRALKYLILNMNLLQNSFEFQILPLPDLEIIEQLSYNKTANRIEIEKAMPEFLLNYKNQLQSQSSNFGLLHEDNVKIVILSSAKFKDNYYQAGGNGWSIIALGNWERVMAPPSIIEFFISMLVRTSIDKACKGSFPSRHIGTKGCCFDFSAQINDARFFVLLGFICSNCKSAIEKATSGQLLKDASILLEKAWLGTTSEPSDVSVTSKKLGHDLFHTMGVNPTFKEKLRNIITEEVSKGFIKVLFLILGTAMLIYLGFKKNG